MARLRFVVVALLALVFAGNSTQLGRSADERFAGTSVTLTNGTPANGADDGSCTIYALADMGYDSELGQWIAQTIPEMIEPSSWQAQGGKGTLRYYQPKNILVIKQSATVQGKVDGFLKDLKKSLPKDGERKSAAHKKTPISGIVPVAYQVPAPLATTNPVPEASSYPVPAPAKTPKHLFHFLIRYEGEGIIDDNVVRFLKTYGDAEKETAGPARHGYYPAAPSPSVAVPAGPSDPLVGVKDTKKKEDKKDEEKDTDKLPH